MRAHQLKQMVHFYDSKNKLSPQDTCEEDQGHHLRCPKAAVHHPTCHCHEEDAMEVSGEEKEALH